MNGQSNNNSVGGHPVLAVLRPGQTVTQEEYEANKRKVAELKRLTKALEESNEKAYDRHIAQSLNQMIIHDAGGSQPGPSFFPNQLESGQPPVEPPPAHYLSPAQSQPSFQQNDINFLPITATIEEVQSPVRPVLLNTAGPSARPTFSKNYNGTFNSQQVQHGQAQQILNQKMSQFYPIQNQGGQIAYHEHHASNGRRNPDELHSQSSIQGPAQLQRSYPSLPEHRQQQIQSQAERQTQWQQQQRQRQQRNFLQYQPKAEQNARPLQAVPQMINVQRHGNGQHPELFHHLNTNRAPPDSQSTSTFQIHSDSMHSLRTSPMQPGKITHLSRGQNVPLAVQPTQGPRQMGAVDASRYIRPTINNQTIPSSQKQQTTLNGLGQVVPYPPQRVEPHQNQQLYHSNSALAGAVQQPPAPALALNASNMDTYTQSSSVPKLPTHESVATAVLEPSTSPSNILHGIEPVQISPAKTRSSDQLVSNTRHVVQRGNSKTLTSEPPSQSHEPITLSTNRPAANGVSSSPPSVVTAPILSYDKGGNKHYKYHPPPNDGNASQSQPQALPTTPMQSQTALPYSPRTPASADKKHLARDILRSLKPKPSSGSSSGKRKGSESLVNPPTKRGRSPGMSELQQTHETSNAALATTPASLVHDASSASVHAQELHLEDAQLNDVNRLLSASPPQQPTAEAPMDRLPTPKSLPDATVRIQEVPEKEGSANEALVAVPKPIQAPVSPHSSSHIQQPEAGPSKNKVPLFLPSPSPASAASFADGHTHHEDVIDVDAWNEPMDAIEKPASHPIIKQSANRKKVPKNEVYILMPPTPAWVRHAKAREKRVSESHRRRQNPKPRKIIEQEDIVADSEEEEPIEDWNVEAPKLAYNRRNRAASQRQVLNRQQPEGFDEKIERLAMSFTYSLLNEQPCKWRNCNVVLNSVDHLSLHLAQHARNKPAPYRCSWKDCIKRFKEEGSLLTHLESHVRHPILCPYKDCDELNMTATDLVAHCQECHDEKDIPRPKIDPFKPVLSRIPPVPHTMPSYMVVPRDVRQAAISRDRHASLGPWVFRNIFAPITLMVERQNAAVPLHSPRRSRTVGEYSKADFSRPRRDDYEFMRPKSPSWRAGTYHFDPLPNIEVSELVHAGLTFWGPQTESVKSEWDFPEGISDVDNIDLPATENQAMPVLDGDDGHGLEGEGGIGEDANEQDNHRSGCIFS